MKDLQLPKITADTPEGQIQQIKSFLFQLVQELNFAMSCNEKTTVEDICEIITDKMSLLDQRVTHIEKILKQGE